MLGGVTDDGDEDHADKDLGEPERVRGLLDGADEEFAHHGHESRRDKQDEHGLAHAPAVRAERLLLIGIRFADVEVRVRLQAEEQTEDSSRAIGLNSRETTLFVIQNFMNKFNAAAEELKDQEEVLTPEVHIVK